MLIINSIRDDFAYQINNMSYILYAFLFITFAKSAHFQVQKNGTSGDQI